MENYKEQKTGILARVKFKNILGADLGYLYQKENLNELGIIPNDFDPSITLIEIGTELTINDKLYKVVNISTQFYKDTFEVDNYGTNVLGMDEQMPFNFQIVYFAENM